MKKIILFTVLSVSACTLLNAAVPQPVNPPAPLPDGVTVSPAQGFVDTSNTTYPLGISRIALTFTQEIIPNPDNETPALLYYQDFDVPAEETLDTSVDPVSWATAGVIFKQRVWTLPGVYKVEIPDGMFCWVDGANAAGERTGKEPVPGMTLYYEIYRGYSVVPGSGSVPKLDLAVLKFTDADEVRSTQKADNIDFYLDNSNNEYDFSYAIINNDGDGRTNEVVFTFGEAGVGITEPGIYGLNIPAGAFVFRINGTNYPNDPEDYIEWSNQEILVKYTIPRIANLTIDPDPDFSLKSFDSFMLYFPDDFTLFFADTMGQSKLYGVDSDGVVDVTRVYAYAKADPVDEHANFVVLRLYDPSTHQVMDSYTPPTPGVYCLRTVPSLLYGIWPPAVAGEEPFTGGSDSYDYYYTVEGDPGQDAVDTPMEITEPGAVYNLQGIKVAEGSISSLPKGIYICGGRKIAVK